MPRADSVLDLDQLARCRVLLSPRGPKESIWPPLAAAALLAVTAVAFAVVMIMAPPVQTEHVAKAQGVR